MDRHQRDRFFRDANSPQKVARLMPGMKALRLQHLIRIAVPDSLNGVFQISCIVVAQFNESRLGKRSQVFRKGLHDIVKCIADFTAGIEGQMLNSIPVPGQLDGIVVLQPAFQDFLPGSSEVVQQRMQA